MDESHSRSYKKWQIPGLPSCPETKSQYALKAEEKILQAISARAPVPETLNEICGALDCQIGNVVSLISMFAERATSPTAISRTAALFGLHVFSTEKIFGGRGQELGSLEMYCCVARPPSTAEVRLMERARHLAALAIEREATANCRAICRVLEKPLVPGRVLEWPDSMN